MNIKELFIIREDRRYNFSLGVAKQLDMLRRYHDPRVSEAAQEEYQTLDLTPPNICFAKHIFLCVAERLNLRTRT